MKEHLVETEKINNLSREENQHLRGENIQNKTNLKIEKTNNKNHVKVLEKKSKRSKKNYPKETEIQVKILRKSNTKTSDKKGHSYQRYTKYQRREYR